MTDGREASDVVQLAIMFWLGPELIKYVTSEHEDIAVFTRLST
jgi:hypothetical protein